MKPKVRVLIVVLIMLLTAASAAQASSYGVTVAARVTPAAVSIAITVVPTLVDYGEVILGQSAVSPLISVTSEGNVDIDIDIEGATACELDPATGGCNYVNYWALSPTPGANQYVHEFGLGSAPSAWTNIWNEALTSTPMVTGLAPLQTQDFKLRITLPTASDATGEMQTTVSLYATQS